MGLRIEFSGEVRDEEVLWVNFCTKQFTNSARRRIFQPVILGWYIFNAFAAPFFGVKFPLQNKVKHVSTRSTD